MVHLYSTWYRVLCDSLDLVPSSRQAKHKLKHVGLYMWVCTCGFVSSVKTLVEALPGLHQDSAFCTTVFGMQGRLLGESAPHVIFALAQTPNYASSPHDVHKDAGGLLSDSPLACVPCQSL